MEIEPLTHSKHVKLVNDYEATASAAHLLYVSDKDPGIARIKNGGSFRYQYQQKLLRQSEELERIRKLAIPPAWDKVWICAKPNGHIQVTGYDIRRRKQYRYHTLWNLLRNETKFHKLLEFGKVLPQLRKQLHIDLSLPELSEKKVIKVFLSEKFLFSG